MSIEKPDANLIVAFEDDVGYLGLGQEHAILIIQGNTYQGRGAYHALMSLSYDPEDAQRSMDYAQYDRDIRSLIFDGRIDMHYLIDCEGMNVFLNRHCMYAEHAVRNHNGMIHAYATHNAKSGGALRLGSADPSRRNVLGSTSILLHERQRPEYPFADASRIAAEFDDDMAMIASFFEMGSASSESLKQETLKVCSNHQDMRFSGSELHHAELGQLVESPMHMQERLLRNLETSPALVPPIVQKFFNRQ